MLRKAGAEVALAENGLEAVNKVLATRPGGAQADHPFDLVLMDIQMPVMDGYEATRRLRKQGFTGPVLALTAHAMPQDVRQCLDAGCDSHLSKPIDRQTLLSAVARFLDPKSPLPPGDAQPSSPLPPGEGQGEGVLLASK